MLPVGIGTIPIHGKGAKAAQVNNTYHVSVSVPYQVTIYSTVPVLYNVPSTNQCGSECQTLVLKANI